MARRKDDDTLEAILPRHPPVAADERPPAAEADGADTAGGDEGQRRSLPAWDRLVLVACAVVATMALVVCALRLSSIAEDERLQACQVRVYAEEQIEGSRGDRSSGDTLRERFADCIGYEPAPDADGDDRDDG